MKILPSLLIIGVVLWSCSGKKNQESDSSATMPEISYSWESIKTYPVAQWFQDAKFGIFIHWGVYAVPGYVPSGYAEWYPFKMYHDPDVRQYHEDTWGPTAEFGYKDFVPMFTAEKWDPEDWAELFYKAGAKYVVPVAEHHDGFAMWDSDLTEWDALDKGPKRDIIGELGQSVRKRGMKYAPSFHRERHFEYFDSGLVAPEIKLMPEAVGLYGPFSLTSDFIDDYVARWKEIETKYQPDFMWLDHVPILYNDSLNPIVVKYKEAIRNMIADYLNTANGWGRDVYFNNKGREVYGINFPIGAGVREADNVDMGEGAAIWQNPATIAHSYGYNKKEEEENTYKSADELISLLVDMVSKNGILLLNVGPRPDGTISETQRERLLQMGEWLKINGEAIYGTHPWQSFGEGPNTDRRKLTAEDIRFTSKDNAVYAIVMDWPDNGQVTIESLVGKEVRSIELLGSGSVEFQSLPDGISITFPTAKPCQYAYVLKINM